MVGILFGLCWFLKVGVWLGGRLELSLGNPVCLICSGSVWVCIGVVGFVLVGVGCCTLG